MWLVESASELAITVGVGCEPVHSDRFEPYEPREGDYVEFEDWTRPTWIFRVSHTRAHCLIEDGDRARWVDAASIKPAIGTLPNTVENVPRHEAPPAPEEDCEAAFWAKNREYWKTQDNPPLEPKPELVIDPVAGWTRGDALAYVCGKLQRNPGAFSGVGDEAILAAARAWLRP